jgi:hypothetical protein
MDPFDTYQRLQALARRRAVPKTTRRHVHLSDRPFVVAAYHLAGEIGAPLAMIWGTSPDPARAGFLAVAEPRNRKERFAALDQFGQAVDAHVGPLMRRHTVQRVSRGRVVGTDKVPRRAAVRGPERGDRRVAVRRRRQVHPLPAHRR